MRSERRGAVREAWSISEQVFTIFHSEERGGAGAIGDRWESPPLESDNPYEKKNLIEQGSEGKSATLPKTRREI